MLAIFLSLFARQAGGTFLQQWPPRKTREQQTNSFTACTIHAITSNYPVTCIYDHHILLAISYEKFDFLFLFVSSYYTIRFRHHSFIWFDAIHEILIELEKWLNFSSDSIRRKPILIWRKKSALFSSFFQVFAANPYTTTSYRKKEAFPGKEKWVKGFLSFL